MFGAAFGDIVGGVHEFDSIETDVPTLSLSSTMYAPATSSGASTAIPTLGLTSTFYAPITAFAIATDVPTLSLSSSLYAPETELILSVDVPVLNLSSTLYEPSTELILAVEVPTLDLVSTLYAPTTAGGASTDVPVVSLSLSLNAPDTVIIINGVPKFYVNRSGSTATLTFTNRGEKEIQIYKSSQHNSTFSSLAYTTSDSYNDSIGTDNYKYKARFVDRIGGSINAAGQKSITKFTKN